jgi:hypothetical protein
MSPDGRQIVFESLGKLWLRPAAGGAPRRLTRGNDGRFEAWPSWSRDGRTITFVSWSDEDLGRIQTVGARRFAAHRHDRAWPLFESPLLARWPHHRIRSRIGRYT